MQARIGLARLDAARFISKRAGYRILERTLRYWEQHGLLKPAHGGGRGIRTVYRLSDIVAASVIATLRRDGASLQRVRRALFNLRRFLPEIIESPHAWRLAVTGRGDVVHIESDRTMLELTSTPGQLAILDFGALVDEARALIEKQKRRVA